MSNNIHKIAVIGIGYVGLPLSFYLSKNYKVIAYDINQKRLKSLFNGYDENKELTEHQVKILTNRAKFTSNKRDLEGIKTFIVTVPTPINKNKKPDLKNLKNACTLIGKVLTKGSIVIFESTVYPGLTENYCKKIIEKTSKLKFKKDFSLGYSPERVNPGDKKRTINKIKKIISASDEVSLDKLKKIYGSIVKQKLVVAKSIKDAEAAKVIENCQRDINISFINELKYIFDNDGINIYEVLKLANSKWNFLNFKPGLVGGHCIGVDPYYLLKYANGLGINPILTHSSRKINEQATTHFSEKIISLVKNIDNPKIIILGCTFKENCPDTRNSKILESCKYLHKKFNNFVIYDPWISKDEASKLSFNFLYDFPEKLDFDLIVLAQNHKIFKDIGIKKIKNISSKKDCIIFDYKNLFNLYQSTLN